MKHQLIVSLVGLFASSVLAITEYVALGPAGLQTGPSISNPVLKWAELQYSADASSVGEVFFSLLNKTNSDVGAWFDLDLSKGGGKGLALTAKIHGDKLYAYIQKNPTETGEKGGCCADTLRIYDRTTGDFTEIDLDSLLTKIFPSSVSFHHATHTFDIESEGGKVFAWLMVQYDDATLGGTPTNAAVMISVADGTVQKTQDGDAYFSFSQHIGTTSTVYSDSIFKVQYHQPSGQRKPEQWHGNGMLRFTTKDGVKLLAITHRADHEAVIMKDPYTYTAANGGGSILQRFGTPGHTPDSTYHRFGVANNSVEWSGGCHNVFYTASSKTTQLLGLETISLFVNSIDGSTTSHVFEFAVKLTEQKPDVKYDDTVFTTKFVSASCGFEAEAAGGTRVIGNGMFLVASGVVTGAQGMLELIDAKGGKKDLAYPGTENIQLYDPFIRVVKSSL